VELHGLDALHRLLFRQQPCQALRDERLAGAGRALEHKGLLARELGEQALDVGPVEEDVVGGGASGVVGDGHLGIARGG